VVHVFKRPFPLTMRVVWPLSVLMVLIPAYVFGPEFTAQRSQPWPELALDRMAPVQPAWAVIYASHLLFVLFPALILREEEQIRRTLWAIVMVWAVGVAFFVVFPTVLHRPAPDPDGGFFAWSLRVVHAADRPYNCFPSLHVAHAFVSAFACHPIHRGVGLGCGVWATLIGISAVFTKQHYVADVLAGVLLAWLAWRLFLRGHSSLTIPRFERRAAPVLLLATIGCWSVVVVGFGSYYWLCVR
jgi:membrane-associated phospholipid phosphatase